MKRKLVKQGSATMMVSLPSKWIKANSLNKGDEVDIEEQENKLIIARESKDSKGKKAEIEISPNNRKDLKNILTHYYRNGMDKIVLKNPEAEDIKEIRKAISLLLGFELTEKSNKQATVENISEPLEQKYEIMLKKVFLIIKETHNLLEEDFKKQKFNNLEEIEESRNQLDKFILFCRRLLSKEQSKSNLEWEFLTFLMHIEHSYYYFYKYCSKSKIKVEKPILELLEELKEYFALLENSYYNQDIASIHKINNLKESYQFGKCLELIEKSKGNAVVYCYIKELFRMTQIASSPVLARLLGKNDYISISAS